MRGLAGNSAPMAARHVFTIGSAGPCPKAPPFPGTHLIKFLGMSPQRAHGLFRPRHPPRESADQYPAAEGATGPRKRSGTKDRSGQGSLESRTARQRGSAPTE
jgi:hypothetical protein